ncbi:MAG: type II toxin-antitoxin system HicB family antitoxin [Phycisphaerae bacterium]
MRYKGYLGKAEFDGEAGILHGEVLGIRDVVTFQGKSVRELNQAFRDSVDDYLAFCQKRGESPDKPYSGQFVVRLDPALHRQASIAAETMGSSLNSVVTESLVKSLSGRLAGFSGRGKTVRRDSAIRRKRRAAQ